MLGVCRIKEPLLGRRETRHVNVKAVYQGQSGPLSSDDFSVLAIHEEFWTNETSTGWLQSRAVLMKVQSDSDKCV
jgi:hypothetical protein